MKTIDLELNVTRGTYLPAALKLILNTDANLENLIGSEFEEIYIHEFTHFIQDISTIYGLTNFILNLDDLASRAQEIYKFHDGSKITRPVQMELNSNTRINRLLFKEYFGQSLKKGDINSSSNWYITIEKKIIEGVISLNSIKVKVEEVEFKLGAFHMMESMAYEIQKFIYNSNSKSPEIPYCVVRNILKKNVKHNLDTLDIISICDASLLSFHPSEALYSLIIDLNKLESKPDLKWYYEYVEDGMNTAIEIDGQNNFKNISDKVSEVIEYLNKIIPDPNLKDQKQWLINKLIKLKDKRLNESDFLATILKSENPRLAFLEFIAEIGSPVIFNSNGFGFTIEKNEKIQDASVYWSSIIEIIRIFYGNSDCSLVEFCKNNLIEGKPNEYCNLSPWNRTTVFPHCYFAKFWKFWKFEKYDWNH
ncbi:hypothetical protein [Leptospira bourretii]|uniref:hypothetical protein n=1 Tax=Leptospira bourretii TaxID=2484962 RepID=UPI001ABF8F5E|nr:hypothetical protein [Leptospira bourretii]